MGSWFIYTSLTMDAARGIEAEVRRAIEAVGRSDEPTGSLMIVGTAPTESEVREGKPKKRMAAEVKKRLLAAQTTIEIEEPPGLEESPLQVSILRYLLERCENALMDWGDYEIELAEKALERMSDHEVVEGFEAGAKARTAAGGDGAPRAGAISAASTKKEKAPKPRAAKILMVLERAKDDPDLLLDLRRMVSTLPPLGQRYLALLVDDGAVLDEAAASELGVPLETLEETIEDVLEELRELTDVPLD